MLRLLTARLLSDAAQGMIRGQALLGIGCEKHRMIQGLTRSQAPTTLRRIRGVHLLAAVLVFDPILDQLNTLLGIGVGPLSLLQAVRGAIIVVLFLVLAGSFRQLRGEHESVTLAGFMLVFALVVFAAKELLDTGTLSFESAVAYLQIVYWILVWQIAALICRNSKDARLLLTAVVVSSLIAAISVFYAYASGATYSYEEQHIHASSAGFISGKFLSGFFLVGAYSAAYLSRFRTPGSLMAICTACIGGSVLTYARAGMLAAAVSLLWLFVWVAVWHHPRAGMAVGALFALLVAFCTVFVVKVGLPDLKVRWSDVSDPARAGSGRLVIWTASLNYYAEADWPEKIAGVGFGRTLDELSRRCGARIHTHSDLFDMLMIGGALGLVCLAAVGAAIVQQIRRLPRESPEFAVGVAILLVVLVHGLTTGQLFGPDAMAAYLTAVTSLVRMKPGPSLQTAVGLGGRKAMRYVYSAI